MPCWQTRREQRRRGRTKLDKHFKLKAQVKSANLRAIQNELERLLPKGGVEKVGEEFVIEAEMEGNSATEVNRTLLSALRKVEKKTTIRAEWTSGKKTTQKFFDYVLKKTVKN
jgi:hypothetical protein